ncbi:MAG: N-6 DNA methylase [Chloroflexi bacterium]|nr:N-6 DNA methylase [Chloroflexota bacterium]
MARRTLDSRPTVRSEGGLLPPELLERITDPRERDLPGLDPSRDYGLESNVRLTEAAARSWEHAKAYWGAFKARLEGSRPGAELGVTRQQWLLPLLSELGYDDLDYRQQAEDVNGRPFHISHRATREAAAPPLHLVATSQALDKADPSAPGPKASPHGFLQSYLNETDHLWGIVSNGRQLRVLRDNASLTRPAYLEFDLEGMMEGGVFADFTLLWMVAHRSRLPKGTSDTDACLLEQWYRAALVRGARALGDLRLGVENAIRSLGQGFLDHPANEELRQKLASGDLDEVAYYRQLLRVVYRLLFLLVAEERDLLFPSDADPRGREIYSEHYSISRLRERLRLDRGDARHDDLWRAQRVAFGILRAGNANLGLPALGGGIFDARMCPDLEDAVLRNDALKSAVRGLSLAPTKSGYRRINYRDLDVEELGSVYESLLDEQPSLRSNGGKPAFTLIGGGERKSTGSYYTPSVLVQELIRSALDPVIQQALASAADIDGKRRALLDLAVCDPACGSGHFLLAAARRIGRELARLASGEHEPDPAVLRHSVREAITHCVYGVDLNPLAVDLCRLALWLEGHEPGRPLGFLDHRIKCGNSLVGANSELIEKGIPTEAFEPVEGDSKDVAKAIKARNKTELTGQLPLMHTMSLEPAGPTEADAKEARAIADFEEETPEDVLLKEQEHATAEARRAHRKRAADLWTAAFFWPLRDEAPTPPTQSTLLHHRAGRPQEFGGAFERQLARVAEEVRPFHWELEFPEVFDERKGGFDCMLGNPPWEKVKLSDKEFFATRAPEVANAPNAAARKRLIEQLEAEDPGLLRDYDEAKALAERTSFYLRQGGRFPLGGAGDVNYYVVFAELLSDLVNGRGQSGILCPSGIATDDTTKALFGKFAAGRVASLYDFENSQGLFEGVHRSYKFCLLTVRGWTDHDRPADFAFFSTSIDHLREPDRHFTLTAEDFALFNPNTRTCPVFRSKRDAEIAKKMYRRAGVFWKEARGADAEENPWDVKFSAMFHMSNDSGLFRTREELEREGYVLKGNVFVRADGREYLPLYEAKLFHQYDHRFATFDGASKEDLKAGNARDMTTAEKANPDAVVIARYWVPAEEVAAKLDTNGEAIRSLDARRSTLDARRSTLDALAAGVPTDRPGDGRADRSLGRHPDSRSGPQRSRGHSQIYRLAFRSIARATDERTVVATMICPPPLGNSGIIVSVGFSASETSPAQQTNEPRSAASSRERA